MLTVGSLFAGIGGLEWEEMAATAGTGETPVLQRREARRRGEE
jgi:hypothetical protein